MTEREFQKQLKKYHEIGEMPVELAIKLLSECAMDCVYEEETEEAKFMAIKALEQESILDKIRAEIEQTVSRYSISRECGCMGQVEWSDRLIKESDVLQILDKYKAESEEV